MRVTGAQPQGFNVFANYETKTCNGATGAASNAYCLGSYSDDADGSLKASWVSVFCGLGVSGVSVLCGLMFVCVCARDAYVRACVTRARARARACACARVRACVCVCEDRLRVCVRASARACVRARVYAIRIMHVCVCAWTDCAELPYLRHH